MSDEEELRERWRQEGMPDAKTLMGRIAELEAQCAAMREALEKVSWGSLPIIRAQGCRECRSLAVGKHKDGCCVGAALASDTGKALFERLSNAEQGLVMWMETAKQARAQAFAECAEIARSYYDIEGHMAARNVVIAIGVAIRAKAGGT